eukprot:CAMPEP_0197533360 /NCGR_PEP_ID=MMETSP1318-20131121/43258_1 /TAXON_ID=552666 /ORGANISM="Partenskyella glossopodia, Strain RCC365" /LENGTH=130 /DNA_ID=CAMNT_0043090241 /DNA_START=159 /DNA_END=551 /DNA_ORIENTATION=+
MGQALALLKVFGRDRKYKAFKQAKKGMTGVFARHNNGESVEMKAPAVKASSPLFWVEKMKTLGPFWLIARKTRTGAAPTRDDGEYHMPGTDMHQHHKLVSEMKRAFDHLYAIGIICHSKEQLFGEESGTH